MQTVLEIVLFDAGPFSVRTYALNYPSIIKFKHGWWCTEEGCETRVFNIPTPFQTGADEPPPVPPAAEEGWTWRIVPDGLGPQRSLLFENVHTGESFYADGRPKEGDVFGQFRLSEGAVKRILARMNGQRWP